MEVPKTRRWETGEMVRARSLPPRAVSSSPARSAAVCPSPDGDARHARYPQDGRNPATGIRSRSRVRPIAGHELAPRQPAFLAT